MRKPTFSRRPMRAAIRGVLCLAATISSAGCGDLTSGGVGEVEVALAADSVDLALLQAGFSELPTPESRPGPATVDGVGPIEGTVTVSLRVYVRRGPRDWVELTDGEQEVTTPLQGGEATVVALADLPVGTYTEARARFSRIHADVTGGLIVDGESIIGRVRVIEPGIEAPLDLPRVLALEVEEGSVASLVVELRAGTWLWRVDRATRRVPPDEFEEALQLRRGTATRR